MKKSASCDNLIMTMVATFFALTTFISFAYIAHIKSEYITVDRANVYVYYNYQHGFEEGLKACKNRGK